MEKHIYQFILLKGVFCQLRDRKVVDSMPQCYLLTGDIQARFLFFSLYKIQMSKQYRFISKLSLTYSANVSHTKCSPSSLCLLCLCGNREYPSKQISKLFFQMSTQVYSVPDQTEGRRIVFLEWTSIDLSSKLSLTCGDNIT